MPSPEITRFIGEIPAVEVIRERIAQNIRERQLLRRILKLAIDREKATSETPEVARG